MKTWEQFTEEKQKVEKIKLPLQRFEPKDRKEGVKKSKKELLDFFEKRKQGAAKIASEAKTKGGPAELTAWHFAAKAQPYNEVLSAIKANKDESYFIHKCYELIDKLKFSKLKQEDFQKLMGKIEVWGEAVAKLFN